MNKIKLLKYMWLPNSSVLYTTDNFQFINATCSNNGIETYITRDVNKILRCFWNDSMESIYIHYFRKHLNVSEFCIKCKVDGELELLKINLNNLTVNGEQQLGGLLI